VGTNIGSYDPNFNPDATYDRNPGVDCTQHWQCKSHICDYGAGYAPDLGHCTVADCVSSGFRRDECEAEDGWDCNAITEHANKCRDTPGCEKHSSEWIGDGVCDFKDCANCLSYWGKDGQFDGGDCKASEIKLTAMKAQTGMTGSDVLIYGLAALGLGCVLFGSYRFYCEKP